MAPDGHPQSPKERAHPLGVASCQIVVDGDDVDAAALQGIEIGGQGRNQGLALTGDHLGDIAPVQDDAAHQLDVEMTHVQKPAARLARGRECLRQEVVKRFSVWLAACRNSSVFARSSSSVRARMLGSNSLICATNERICRMRRSFELPKSRTNPSETPSEKAVNASVVLSQSSVSSSITAPTPKSPWRDAVSRFKYRSYIRL